MGNSNFANELIHGSPVPLAHPLEAIRLGGTQVAFLLDHRERLLQNRHRLHTVRLADIGERPGEGHPLRLLTTR